MVYVHYSNGSDNIVSANATENQGGLSAPALVFPAGEGWC